MAKVKIEDIVEYLDNNFKKAVFETIKHYHPDTPATKTEMDV
jgi:hypothetical protein